MPIQRVQLPDPTQFKSEYVRGIMQYVVESAKAAGIETAWSDDLKVFNGAGMAMQVDDVTVGLDLSDYTVFRVPVDKYPVLFRLQHGAWFEPHHNVGSIPQQSFHDWDAYAEIAAAHRYTARGRKIGYRVCVESDRYTLTSRRQRGRELLTEAFGHRVRTSFLQPARSFWQVAMSEMVCVNIGGTYNNVMDRAMVQMMGLGVCVVCPEVFATCCEVRPTPHEHYIPVRDDLSDLTEKIHWCDHHQDELLATGRRAQEFFRTHCMPRPVWEYIEWRIAHPTTPRLMGEIEGTYLK
jgi:hypothetical protein